MEKLLVLLYFVFLMSPSTGTILQTPCPTTVCPWYTVLEDHVDFQKREYKETKWLTTKVTSLSMSDLLNANDILAKFCSDNKIDMKDSWPVLLTIYSNGSYSLSWFLPKNLNVRKQQGDSSVQLRDEPFIVYVSSFKGLPSMENGQFHAEVLWDKLKTHLKKSCAIPTFTGATYNSATSLTHTNEIWIRLNDIC